MQVTLIAKLDLLDKLHEACSRELLQNPREPTLLRQQKILQALQSDYIRIAVERSTALFDTTDLPFVEVSA